MSVEREGVRAVAAVLRGIISLADGPSYINAANQVYKALEARGLIIEQQPHFAVVIDGVVEIRHPNECLLEPEVCELQVRLDSYDENDKLPNVKDGEYVVDWDEKTPWDLGFKKATAAQRKVIAARADAKPPVIEEQPRKPLANATEVLL